MILSAIVAQGNTLTAPEKQSLTSYTKRKTKELRAPGLAEGLEGQRLDRAPASPSFARGQTACAGQVFWDDRDLPDRPITRREQNVLTIKDKQPHSSM
jgi:hypothetical protein